MESASELVEFPLLLTPIDSNYRACTIPYRFPSDNPRKPTPTEISWIDLFLNSIPSFKCVSHFSFLLFTSKKIDFLVPDSQFFIVCSIPFCSFFPAISWFALFLDRNCGFFFLFFKLMQQMGRFIFPPLVSFCLGYLIRDIWLCNFLWWSELLPAELRSSCLGILVLFSSNQN